MNTNLRIFLTSSLYIAFVVGVVIFTASAAEALHELEEAKLEGTMQYIMQQNVSLRAELAESQEILQGINLKPLGEFEVTHYSYNSGTTKDGSRPKEGTTVAVDDNLIPLGSTLYVQGYGILKAQDTGKAIIGKSLDIFIKDYDKAVRMGRKEDIKVWLVE